MCAHEGRGAEDGEVAVSGGEWVIQLVWWRGHGWHGWCGNVGVGVDSGGGSALVGRSHVGGRGGKEVMVAVVVWGHRGGGGVVWMGVRERGMAVVMG